MDRFFLRHNFLWTVHHGHTEGVVDTRHESVVSANGQNGKDGADGAPGDMLNPPGGGGDGEDGTGSQSVVANGAGLTFGHNPANPSWSVSATSGKGGHGGDGGHIGSFPFDPPYAVPHAGEGGDGGLSGDATAEIVSRAIFAHTGTTSGVGVAIAISSVTHNGGAGATGGSGSGEATSGGRGGNGGNGGGVGLADTELNNDVFKTVSDPGNPKDVRIALTLSAVAGDGGDGGYGGAGIDNGITGSSSGFAGAGGDGGGANLVIMNDTITLGGKAGGAAIATIVATARAGDGGDGGGAFGVPTNYGTPGDGGSASVSFVNVQIHGGATDDTVRMALNVAAGQAGTNGNGDHGTDGLATLSVTGCAFDGGKGVNTLAFSWSGNTTASAVNVNLASGFFQVAGGPSNGLTHFQNVTGGSGFDALTGDSHANTLGGGLGDDLLLGAGGNDRLIGGAGDDSMTGGAAADTFAYNAVSDSTGTVFDRITDLDFAQDKLDVDFHITGLHATVNGMVFADTFNANMESLAKNLGKHHAMLVNSGNGSDFDGHTFLIADVNGHKGYQAGHDLLIDVTGATNVDQFSADIFV